MTDLNGWEQQPGGLWLKVSPYDKNDPADKAVARHVIGGTIRTISSTHGASYSEKGFRDNMRAIESGEGDLEAEYYRAKWDVCERKVFNIGSALGWAVYSFTPDGRLVRGRYTEDVALLTGPLRELIRTKPKGKRFPEASLAKCFERISLDQMRNDGMVYRYGEVAPDNTAMNRQLDDNGASKSTRLDSAVLEYERLPENLLDYLPETVRVIPIRSDGVKDKRNFIVRWQEGSHDIRFIVTKGRATTPGKPRVDIRPWDNGNLPDPYRLEGIIAHMLRAAKFKAEEENWNVQTRREYSSPNIPLLGSRRDMHKALFEACEDEIIISTEDRQPTFYAPMPETHVHVIGSQRIVDTVAAVKGKTRRFGDRPMIPRVNILGGERRLVA